MNRHACWLIGLSLVLCWLAPPELAQADEDDRARAAKHYKLGAEHFKNKRYAEAVTEYRNAYRISPAPLLLFNIGLAHRANEEPEEALTVFRLFLDQRPTGKVSDEAREYVEELERVLADERVRKQLEPEKRAAALRAQQERDRRVQRTGRGLRLTGLALAGSGIAVLSTGLVFGINARSLHSDFENHEGPWSDDELARIDDGEAAERNSIILSSIGGALLIAGGASYLLGLRARANARRHQGKRPATSSLLLAPTLSSRRVGLLVTGRF